MHGELGSEALNARRVMEGVSVVQSMSFLAFRTTTLASQTRLTIIRSSYSCPFRTHSRSIATMANKESLQPARDFIEFVNASPTRMPLPCDYSDDEDADWS